VRLAAGTDDFTASFCGKLHQQGVKRTFIDLSAAKRGIRRFFTAKARIGRPQARI